MIKTLRNRSFALLWLGGLISMMGDWVLLIGLPIYVYLLTRSVLATSLTILSGAVPSIFLGSIAGVFVDRWDRRRTLILANLLLALVLLPLLLVRSAGNVWIVYAVSFAANCLDQFVSPAQNALLPALVGEEHLVPANSLTSLSSNLARLAGPALGGLVAAAFSLNGIVLADACSFLLAALCVAGIVVPAHAPLAVPASPVPVAAPPDLAPASPAIAPALPPAPAPVDTAAGSVAASTPAPALHVASSGNAIARLWRDWMDGLRVIRGRRVLAVLLAMFAVTALGEGVFGALYPIFVYRVLHGGALQIGQLMSAQAVGGLLGGLLVGVAGKRVMSRWTIGLGQVLFGLLDLAIFNTPALFPVYWLSVGLFVAVGIPGLFSSTGAQSLLQVSSPDAYRGRVFGALGTTFGLTLVLGALLAGVITDRLGVVTVLNIQGAGYILAGLFVLLLLPRARASTPPPVSPVPAPPDLIPTARDAP